MLKIDNRKLWVSAKDYLFIVFGLFLFAFGFSAFIAPEGVITGGMAGIGQIVYYATYKAFGWGIPVAVSMYAFNVVLLIFAYRIVGRTFVVRTIVGVTLVSTFIGVLQPMFPEPLVNKENAMFMNVIIGSIISGVGLGLTFAHNGSSGGTDTVAAMMVKRTNVSMGRTMQMCDVCIISSSLLIFGLGEAGFERLVYGMVVLLLMSFSADWVINTNRQAIQFIIFSPSHWEEIATAINNDAHRGCTILNGMGWYSKHEVKVLLVMCRKIESQTIYRIIRSIDKDAFITQANVNGVYGKGFDELKLRMPKPGSNAAHGVSSHPHAHPSDKTMSSGHPSSMM
ncbi:MAG: YitT family protein [Muribaculaceae bacterium]|nr:YitT family protein [Muribaculaceae bacterium]